MTNGSNKDRQLRYLSQAIQLEEAANPNIIRSTMFAVSLAVLCFLGWAGLTNINEVARAPGEIVPQGFSQIVQHLEGGIVQKINVREGDLVEAGQVLLEMNGGGVQEDLDRAHRKSIELAMHEERLRAYLEDRTPDFNAYEKQYPDMVKDKRIFFESMILTRRGEQQVIEEQIRQKKHNIQTLRAEYQTAQNNYAITKDLYERRRILNEKGYASDIQFLETKQRLNTIAGEMANLQNRISTASAEISEFESRLMAVTAQSKDEAYTQLDAIIAEQAQNNEILIKLKNRTQRLSVQAPVRGLVKGLGVNTVGAVVQPGQVLMEIVPQDEDLVAQVRIQPQHIGHLKVGQPVQLKFSSFDFLRYGTVPGSLGQVSATTFSGENGDRYYKGFVTLDRKYVGADHHNTVVPGMTVMADIVTGRKTILAYLLKPIHVSLRTAFTER